MSETSGETGGTPGERISDAEHAIIDVLEHVVVAANVVTFR